MMGRSKNTNGVSSVEMNLSKWRYENMIRHVMILIMLLLCNYVSIHDAKISLKEELFL